MADSLAVVSGTDPVRWLPLRNVEHIRVPLYGGGIEGRIV
jgi:hypothetical protein